jgi:nitrogen fixation protein
MTRFIRMLVIGLALTVPSMALAGPEVGGVLLTSGTVKRVDLEKGIVVLDSGRIIAVRMIQRNGLRVELREVKPEDDVFVSGNDLGFSAEIASKRVP